MVTIGDEVTEMFLITSGEAAVFSLKSGPLAEPGCTEKIGKRRKGNLVGEIPGCDGEKKLDGSWASSQTLPRSKLTVVATTETRALVFTQKDVVWAVGHDYRLSDEFEFALRERRRAIAKMQRLAVRAERTAAGGRAASESMKRPAVE